MTPTDRIVPALASELGDAVAALLGESTTTSPIVNGGEAGWMIHLSVHGPIDGEVIIGLPADAGRRISALVAGAEGEPDDAAVLDTLREVCSQAVGSMSRKEVAAGLTLEVSDVAPAGTPTLEAAHAFEFTVRETAIRFFVHATLVETAATDPSGGGRNTGDESASPFAAVQTPAAAAGISTQNLDVLLDVELPVSVRFGQAELPLQALIRLAPGSVVDLHRTADEPVDVLVGGKVIARGEVVVVDGNYGVRVLEIVSAAERIRSLGA